MQFIVDAQLPPRLARFITSQGYPAEHVGDRKGGLIETDSSIAQRADANGAVVVTKDADFKHSHFAIGTPCLLLVINTGNISNRDLLTFVGGFLPAVVEAFESCDLVELYDRYMVGYPRSDARHQ